MTVPIACDLACDDIRNMAPAIVGRQMVFPMPRQVQDALAARMPFYSRLGHPANGAKLVHQVIKNDVLNGKMIRLDGAIQMAPKRTPGVATT